MNLICMAPPRKNQNHSFSLLLVYLLLRPLTYLENAPTHPPTHTCGVHLQRQQQHHGSLPFLQVDRRARVLQASSGPQADAPLMSSRLPLRARTSTATTSKGASPLAGMDDFFIEVYGGQFVVNCTPWVPAGFNQVRAGCYRTPCNLRVSLCPQSLV